MEDKEVLKEIIKKVNSSLWLGFISGFGIGVLLTILIAALLLG